MNTKIIKQLTRFITTALFTALIGIWAPGTVNAVTCTGLPAITSHTTLSNCTLTVAQTTGADYVSGNIETSTTNGAVLQLNDGASLTINSGGKIAVGSILLRGGTIAIDNGGLTLPNTPLYAADADGDGWATDFSLTTATASGKRRLGLMRSPSTSDCNDSSFSQGSSCAFGTGNDGAVTISSNKNINTQTIAGGRFFADGFAFRVTPPSDGATSVTRYTVDDTFSTAIMDVGDEVLLINLQGTSSDFADVGNYEFMTVSAVTASTITFTQAITRSFDGTSAANQKVVIQRVPNYTNVTINNGITLTASVYDSLATTPTGTAGYYTGIVAFRATGTITVTGAVSVNGRGRLGSPAPGSSNPGTGGGSFCGTGGGTGGIAGTDPTNGSCGGGGGGPAKASGNAGASGSATGGAGGGGGYCSFAGTVRAGGSGGGGGYGTAGGGAGRNGADGGTGTSGDGGSGSTSDPCVGGGGGGGGTYGAANLTTLFSGSGGGSGSSYSLLDGGAGGDGGGIIYIAGSTVSISGGVTANGTNGGNKSQLNDNYSGAGGGGAGGSVYLLGASVTLGSNLVTAASGSGGSGTAQTAAGDGGSGRIAVGASTVSGTTSPTYTAVAAP